MTDCCDYCRDHDLTVRESARHHGERMAASAEKSYRIIRWAIGFAIMALALATVASLAACGPDKATTETVRSGSYCRQAGVNGQTDAGRPMVCATTGTDSKLRWRAR